MRHSDKDTDGERGKEKSGTGREKEAHVLWLCPYQGDGNEIFSREVQAAYASTQTHEPAAEHLAIGKALARKGDERRVSSKTTDTVPQAYMRRKTRFSKYIDTHLVFRCAERVAQLAHELVIASFIPPLVEVQMGKRKKIEMSETKAEWTKIGTREAVKK